MIRPDETEYTAWAKGYVEAVEGSDILEVFPRYTDEFLSLATTLHGDFSYAPGKWTVKEVVGHVTDTERIFSYRLLCVARADQTPFPGFEQDDYLAVSRFNERTLPDLLSEFQAVRQSSLMLIRGLPDDCWSRRGTVSGHSVTPLGLAYQLTGHERHHYRILRDRYRVA
jgi:hypothetical protein